MRPSTLALLKELTEAHAVPGSEEEVRAIIRKHMAPIAEIEQDRLGSIVCRKKGTAERPRVMLPGHMDEIGFMVKFITDEGFLRFTNLGGWYPGTMLGHPVVIKGTKGKVPGVIGSKPPHLLDEEERKNLPKREDMFIDIGASSRKEAEENFGIRMGDSIVPVTEFSHMRNRDFLMAKAWDDRVGCAVFIEVLKALAGQKHPNTVYGVGTIQEEVGLRGATTARNVVDPDLCLVLESGLALDVPGSKKEEGQGALGKGPQIYLRDSGMIAHRRFLDFVLDVAKKHRIPVQLSVLERGATDGGPIHLHSRGVPSLFLGVPARYIHSHVGIIHARDFDRAVRLIVAVVKRLDAKTLERLVA